MIKNNWAVKNMALKEQIKNKGTLIILKKVWTLFETMNCDYFCNLSFYIKLTNDKKCQTIY